MPPTCPNPMGPINVGVPFVGLIEYRKLASPEALFAAPYSKASGEHGAGAPVNTNPFVSPSPAFKGATFVTFPAVVTKYKLLSWPAIRRKFPAQCVSEVAWL